MSVKQRVTAEQLWEMPEKPGVNYELVDGEIVEMPGGGGLHSLIASLLFKLIDAFAVDHDLGLAFPDNTSYVLRRDPDLVRIPDVSFLAWDRVPEGGIPEGYIRGAPNVAAEVVSPHDRAMDVHEKVNEYLDAGTQLVWVLWPRHQSVTVSRADGTIDELGPADDLDGENVLPGFRVRVGELFEVRRKH